MVLVLRLELGLSPGKAAVQVAHAAVMLAESARDRRGEVYSEWLRAGQKKIVVTARTMEDLQELARQARARKLPSVLVQDAGLTEVAPGTVTVLGIGPGPAREIDPITGSLPLY
ncbi:MAG: peptidyl-tRNA hydrolase Pth2 [Thermoplasmata archaeon]|nr:peptidyl-tRNA hydrolase Pth2 [Thermoplasmata archaeon]